MWCKKCDIVMSITGTTYERKKNKNGESENLHRRYCQCPRCNGKVYNNSENFQETLKKEFTKKKPR